MSYTREQVTADHSHTWLIIARIALIIAILGWMYVIFSFSAQNATNSTAASDKVVYFIQDMIGYMTGKTVNLKVNATHYYYVEYAVRKAAHMFIYFVLSINIMLFLFTFKRIPMIIRMLLTTVVCFGYALTDEFHQSFVAGRGPSFRDCLIDTSGAVIGLIAALLIYCVIYTIYTKYQKYKINAYNEQLSYLDEDDDDDDE